MTKIEEITALLIDEISDFKNSLEELKRESIKLDEKEFTIDTSQIKTVFGEFNQRLNRNYKLLEKQELNIQNKLDSKIALPKWIVIALITYSIIILSSFSYNFYQYQNSKKIREEAFQKGKNQIETHILKFFKAYPKTSENYKKWQNEK